MHSIHPSHHPRPHPALPHPLVRGAQAGVEKDGVLCSDYAVYALGSRLPAPLDLWDTSACATCTSHLDANGDAPRHPNAINGKPAILHYTHHPPTAERKRRASRGSNASGTSRRRRLCWWLGVGR
jgi:hypothetical protein